MNLIYGSNTDSVGLMIAGFFHRETGHPVEPPYTAMGWLRGGKLVGQAIFHNYTGPNVEIHFNGPKSLNRKSLNDIAEYVFKQIGCERLSARVYSTNDRISQIVQKIGFEYESTSIKYYRDDKGNLVDAINYVIFKEDGLKWIKNAQEA
jgi:RimJ/RimL family protein N-acetyltransferase